MDIDDNLRLRPAIEQDAERIFMAIDEFRQDLRHYLPFVDTTFDSSDSLKYIRFTKSVSEEIFVVESRGEFCGLAGFRDTDRAASKTEIGYWLTPPFRGKGIMRRCVQTLCTYAFTQSLNCIYIRCAVDNVASSRIPQSLGFSLIDIEQHGELLVSGWTDLQVWKLEREP